MSASTKICVARHGETDWNAAGILQGWLDVPLNDKGRDQSRELADRLADSTLSCVYSSPLRRALESAEIVSERLKLAKPICHEGLKERNFGLIQGVPKEQLARTHPDLMREIIRRNPACEFEQGESVDHFATRVVGALSDIADHNPGRRVLVITHGWVMDVITRHVNNLPRTAVLHLKRKNIECVWLDVNHDAIVPSAA